jgi:hypothetical protein
MSGLAKKRFRNRRLTRAKVRGNWRGKRGTGAEKSAGCGINCRGFAWFRMRKTPYFPGFIGMAQPLLKVGTEYQPL